MILAETIILAHASSALIIAAVVGAAGTAYGASQNSKAAKANAANQSAFGAAQQQSEAEARKLYDGLIAQYNKSKEKTVDGLSLREYIGNQVEALNDPQLKQAYYSSREQDWATAQRWADQASTQNVSVFNKIVDEIGGGSYKNLISARNNAILGDNIDAAYQRASELKSSQIPAGSVRKDASGQALPNSRADKFTFNTAYEEVQKANDRVFQKSTQAINDDRTAAERQQVQAQTFLPFLDYSAYTTNSVTNPFNQAKLATSLNALNNDAQLAGAALGKAVQNPLAPQQLDATAGNQYIQQGSQLAVAALGQYFQNQKQSSNNGVYSTSFANAVNSNNSSAVNSSSSSLF